MAGRLLCVLLLVAALIEAKDYSQKVMCFPGLDDCNKEYGDYDPPATDYIQKRLGPGIGLGVACIVICCIVWWFWCCCRCWATCCSCCRMRLCQCCCGAGVEPKDMKFTKYQRMTILVSLIIAFCLIGVGGALGYLGGHKTFDGSVDLMDQALAAVTKMETLNSNVAKVAFTALGQFYSGAGSTVTYDDASVTKAITDVKKIINDAKDTLKSVDDGFNYGIPGFFGFCLAITLLGFFSWMCSKGCCSLWMGIIGAGLLFLSWLLFAVFYGVGVFLDDTCVNLSDHYFLDCMKEPGKTCQRAKLTDFFQCPKITTVSTYYANAWNLLDTATGNGAGANAVGSNVRLLNMWYANTNQKKVDGTAWTRAPAALDRTKAKCGTGYCNTVTSQDDDVLGMEPYTTCSPGYSNNVADSTLDSYLTTPIVGNRAPKTDGTDRYGINNQDLCIGGANNAGTAGPQNSNLVATADSTNPPWAESTNPTGTASGYTIGTCERACLNASATSASILDSLSNFGGNCMFRKFVYESFTTVYDSSSSRGYAACGSTGASSKIAWTTNNYITSPQLYQNYSSWMGTYSAGSTTDPCVPATFCALDGNGAIPFSATATADTGTNYAACFQAAAMAASDIMYALSYIASCEYIKTFALLTAVESTGACFDLGDGLVYLMAAQGLIGLGFFIVTVVGIMGHRRWDSENYEENKKDEKEDEDVYAAAQVDKDQEAPQDLPAIEEGTGTEMNPVSQTNEGGASVGVQPTQASQRDKWV